MWNFIHDDIIQCATDILHYINSIPICLIQHFNAHQWCSVALCGVWGYCRNQANVPLHANEIKKDIWLKIHMHIQKCFFSFIRMKKNNAILFGHYTSLRPRAKGNLSFKHNIPSGRRRLPVMWPVMPEDSYWDYTYDKPLTYVNQKLKWICFWDRIMYYQLPGFQSASYQAAMLRRASMY